jgi:hypothetical protein
MELDLQSLFGSSCHCVRLYSLAETPQLPPPLPPLFTRALYTEKKVIVFPVPF